MTTDESSWNRVVALHARIENELTKALSRRHGLGLSEYRALSRLVAAVDKSCSLRIQELADMLCLNQSSVSRLVARLEASGLTERDICEQDRRGIYTMITTEGRTRFTQAEPTYQETLKTALDKAAADPDLATAVVAFRTLTPA
ncbi:DNA-binding MarR family transcriptional regulator [Kibdelosporangium banguiense]|uniref:DNA-binding MarR family transcriptional regulator n=1 Tax=Kibdelosporangium banguiense TaxID=1365924 RepID=A0ABS4TCJ3_9PSEU|nr:MarR family transcriptional regulator [Kibdelosporangium banguiense]MBP2322137.1 DNA-binding MarR family transcriptional regulator [Kibdelosporangium banguiense]